MNRVGIFIEAPRYLTYATYLADRSGALIITNSKEVYDRITISEIPKYYIPDLGVINLLSFKKKFRALPVDSIILFSDTSPAAFWVQKNYKTLMVSEDFIFGRGDLFYANDFQTLLSGRSERCGFMLRTLQKIAGPKSVLDGKTIYFRPCRLYSILIFMMWRVVFRFKEVLFSLPGRYATKISVYSDAYKAIYMNSGVSSDRLIVTGSISFESCADAISRLGNNPSGHAAVDVILFTQPFHKYPVPPKEIWLSEIRRFVEDCEKSKASYLVALHPRDDIEFYSKVVPEEFIVTAPRTDEQNIGLVRSSKLVVLKTTTTIVLPILLKKPVAYINYTSYSDMNMMKHFQKEMILYNQNRVHDILSYIDKNLETVISHQDKEVRSTCFAITGVKDRIMNIARSLV